MRPALVVALITFPIVVPAQVPQIRQVVSPGSRVRLELNDGRTLEGTLMSQSDDSVTIAKSGAIRTTVRADDAAIGGIVGAERWTTVRQTPLKQGIRRSRTGQLMVGVSIGF